MSADGLIELSVSEITPIGPELVQIRLNTTGTPLDEAPRKPGQYVRMTVGDEKPSYFAIASATIDRGSLVFVLKRGTAIVDSIAAAGTGSKVRTSLPEGNGFPMGKIDPEQDLWLFAMGTGITPIRPVVEYVIAHRGTAKQTHLYYGCRRKEAVPFAEDLERWRSQGTDVQLVISGEKHEHIQNLFARNVQQASGIIFVCGKKELVADLRKEADRTGIGAANVFQNF